MSNAVLRGLVLACLGVLCGTQALAQTWPARPIRVYLGFGPAGSTDAILRYYAPKMSQVLNQPVIVDNKPGAAQIPAIKAAMSAPPDGYALFFGTGSAFSQGPAMRKDLPYDPLKDFTLIGLMAVAPGVIFMSPDLPVRSMRELVNYSIANPSKLNYGSSGVGAASHLQMEYLMSLTGLKATHIPYKSDADIVREIMAGNVQLGMSTIQGAITFIGSGKVRALTVTNLRRQKALPDVVSLSEIEFKGIENLDPYSFYGLAGPLGTPPVVVSTLNEAINKVSRMPEVVSYMQEKLYAEPGTGSPAAFRSFIEKDQEKWRPLAKTIKLTD